MLEELISDELFSQNILAFVWDQCEFSPFSSTSTKPLLPSFYYLLMCWNTSLTCHVTYEYFPGSDGLCWHLEPAKDSCIHHQLN